MNRKEYDTPRGKAVFEYDGNGVGRITLECMDMLMDMIENSVWIPCNERLPEETGRYLCTVGAPYRNPREMYYAPQEWADKSNNATWRSTDGNYVFDWFVEAWQPLPEPWKGADDESLLQ